MIVHEAPRFCGFGAELAAILAEAQLLLLNVAMVTLLYFLALDWFKIWIFARLDLRIMTPQPQDLDVAGECLETNARTAEMTKLTENAFRDVNIAFANELAPDKKPQSYGKALDVIFDKFVKDRIVQPTFITNPPREISPLAKASRDNPEEAERFELLVAGMEIANAFSELTDPAEQRARFEEQARERSRGDEETMGVDLDYVEALEYGLPPTGGEGIGIDRLTMILANRRSIREVILFPILRPR